MGYYLGIVLQIVFSLNMDIIMGYSTWQSPKNELKYSTRAKNMNLHISLMMFTGALIIPNFLTLIFSLLYMFKSILDQL
jgi:hypothetical protein